VEALADCSTLSGWIDTRTMTWPKFEVNAALPRRVTGLEHLDPILVVFGEDWWLKLACPWRGTIASVRSTGSTQAWRTRRGT
jgi:hypothetical protein